MSTLDTYVNLPENFDRLSFIKKYSGIAGEYHFWADNPRLEYKFVNEFISIWKHFPIANTWYWGTYTPEVNAPDGKKYTFDLDFIAACESFSKQSKMTLGCAVEPEKADNKRVIWQELFPSMKIDCASFMDFTFYERLKQLPDDEQWKVIFKMRGEWAPYTRALFCLHQGGKRNIIAGFMKATVAGKRWAPWFVDIRGNNFRTEQIPPVPFDSIEYQILKNRCPRCGWPLGYTKPDKKTGLHKCYGCGVYVKEGVPTIMGTIPELHPMNSGFNIEKTSLFDIGNMGKT